MLDFRTPTLADKEIIDSFVRESGQIGCDVSFANTFLWRHKYHIKIAFDGDSYYKCYSMNGNVSGYALPMTRGDLRTAVDKVLADAKERGIKPLIGLLNDTNAERLSHLYAGQVMIENDRDAADYIYERTHLAELAGKKYHAKRNHISRFLRTYEDYEIRELCADNFSDAMLIAERWQQGAEDTGELSIIREAFENFDALGMFGLALYVEGEPAAMCIASELNCCVCDVNFEKALDFEGAYAVINNEFTKRFDQYTLVNREEDMGLEGLRKAKLSYHPDILYSKSIARFK
ncbi:phosphatidylglycerol lysyltransferase domain-containing protein [uncultured Ruminococcus sp.]|uniref:DUF2156 domain-containing protein n=1 Tax=uncultured Ruminococcus sp. TaxID=165186 RepID=UPI00292FDE0C|nr:phosphatidylglycerol lysyltransferase domain-containing protein [uncultured Ruminococcus sp.]